MFSVAQGIEPFLDTCLAAAHIVPVHGELACDGGIVVLLLQVLHTASQAGTLVGGEGNEGLAIEVVLLEKGEHDLRPGAPPHGTTDKDGLVAGQVHTAVEGWQLTFALLFERKVAQGLVGHAVVFVRLDFKLVGTGEFRDVIGHDFRVAHLDVTHRIVVARVREEHDERFLPVIVGRLRGRGGFRLGVGGPGLGLARRCGSALACSGSQ